MRNETFQSTNIPINKTTIKQDKKALKDVFLIKNN